MNRPTNQLTLAEQLNFLLTNRIPRQSLTRFMGWYSKIRSPLLTRLSIAVWRLFARDLDFSEAKKANFESLHDCFIRELKPDSRLIDQRDNVLISPCDAVVGSCGKIEQGVVYQAKGFPYKLCDLIPDKALQAKLRSGHYVTLRLKSSMYHRFHAPVDCLVNKVTYISGDTWNVNPIALKRVERLFCKNERAVIELKTGSQDRCLVLVPVAAILVASMRFHCLDAALNLQYRGPNELSCSETYRKGDEMGYFEHGSTILVFASDHYELHSAIKNDQQITMGSPLLVNTVTY